MNIEKHINKLIIISSPSGAGKTTLCKLLKKRFKNISLSISYTTRTKRITEKNKKDYFFTDKKNFTNLKNKNFFIETAKIFDNYYGTLKEPVTKSLSKGKDVLFDIDWQGTQQLKKIQDLTLTTFFILPPNIATLKERLFNRHKDQETLISKRMAKFNEELSHWDEYNYVVVNDDLEMCYKKIIDIIKSEKKGIKKKQNLDNIKNKVKQLIV